MPSTLGMRMSMTTTSGRFALGQRQRLCTVAGLTHHPHSGLLECITQDTPQECVVLGDHDLDVGVHSSQGGSPVETIRGLRVTP